MFYCTCVHYIEVISTLETKKAFIVYRWEVFTSPPIRLQKKSIEWGGERTSRAFKQKVLTKRDFTVINY